MNENFINEIKEIQNLVDAEVIKHNENERKINILKNSLREFDESKIEDSINDSKSGIYILKNPYNRSVHQKIMDENTNFLKNELTVLVEKIDNLQNIKKNVNVEFDNADYNNISTKLVSAIDKYLESATETIKNANAVLNHEFDLEEVVENNKEAETIVEENTPTIEEVAPIQTEVSTIEPKEVQIDELDKLADDLNNELQPIQEDKKELEKFSEDLNNYSYTQEPVLEAEEQTDLKTFLESVPNSDKDEIESASDVISGPVKVESIEPAYTFESEETIENEEGPVLGRTA